LESGVGYFASRRVQLLYTAWGRLRTKRNEAQRSRSGATLLSPLPKRYSHFMHFAILYAHALDFDRPIAKARDPRSTASGKEFHWSNESRQGHHAGHHADITIPKTMRGRRLRSPVAIVFLRVGKRVLMTGDDTTCFLFSKWRKDRRKGRQEWTATHLSSSR
jgi:hypothetical protein